MTLQKSKDRKSMQEFVDVVRAKREDFVNKGKSWFNSLTGQMGLRQYMRNHQQVEWFEVHHIIIMMKK